MLGAQRACQLSGGERLRCERTGAAAVVEGERAELTAEVGDVGGEGRRRTAAQRVEQRSVADQATGHPRDAGRAHLLGQLEAGGAVAHLPDPVERPVAEGGVAAAAQVKVPVPDAPGLEVAVRENVGLQAVIGIHPAQQRDSGVDLLDRSRRAHYAVCAGVQGRPRREVVDVDPDRRARMPQGTIKLPAQLTERRRNRRRAARGSGRARPRDCGAGRRGRGVLATAAPGEAEGGNPADQRPLQADSSSSEVWGPTQATESSSATPAATSRTSSIVT